MLNNTKHIILLLFILISFSHFSQNDYSIILLNEEFEPVPLASVYIKQSRKGGYSNFKGEIKLTNLNIEDTIVINCMGFEKQIITVSDLSDTVILKQNSVDLKGVTVKSEYKRKTYGVKQKFLIINKTQHGRYVGYINGVVMTINRKSQLENVELYIKKACDSSRTKFLLMIYSVNDTTDLPNKSLLSSKIFFDVSNNGWSKINLDSLNIRINKRVFIGVETVPNYDFEDAPGIFTFTNKPHAKYEYISYFHKKSPLLLVHGHVGLKLQIGFDDNRNGAHNNFPRIRATIKY